MHTQKNLNRKVSQGSCAEFRRKKAFAKLCEKLWVPLRLFFLEMKCDIHLA